MRHFAYDFEATVPPDNWVYNRPESNKAKTRLMRPTVYSAGLVDIDNLADYRQLNSIDEFLDTVFQLPSCWLYAHNQSGYDGWFVMTALLARGFVQIHQGDHNRCHTRYFIGDEGNFTVFNDNGRAYNFYDSRHMLKGNLAQFGRFIGHDKGSETPLVPIGSTLTDTYHAYHDSDGRIHRLDTKWTWEEHDQYLKDDCLILAKVLADPVINAITLLENGLGTEAGIANASRRHGNDLSHLTRKEEFRVKNAPLYPKPPIELHDLHEANHWPRPHYIGWDDEKHEPIFDTIDVEKAGYVNQIPRLAPHRLPSNRLIDEFTGAEKQRMKKIVADANFVVREGYKGGVTLANPIYACQTIPSGTKVDKVSMYPSLYSTMPLPGNIPVDVADSHSLSFSDIVHNPPAEFGYIRLKNLRAKVHHKLMYNFITGEDEMMPSSLFVIKPRTDAHATGGKWDIYASGKSYNEVYSPEIDFSSIVLPLIEVQYLAEHYDIESVEVADSIWYDRDELLMQQFQDHNGRWMTKKHEAAQGPGKQSFAYHKAKLMLNAAYGKLGEAEKSFDNNVYRITDKGLLIVDKGTPQLGGRSDADLPAAGYITAYARLDLANTINKIGMNRFLYSDTDSICFIGSPQEVGLETGSNLGDWELENYWRDGIFIGPKTYGMETENAQGEWEWHTTTAGASIDYAKDQFKPGGEVVDKRAVKTTTGTVICGSVLKIGKEAVQQRVASQWEKMRLVANKHYAAQVAAGKL